MTSCLRVLKDIYIYISLPEFMNFKLFGKAILVVIIKFELFLGHPLGQ